MQREELTKVLAPALEERGCILYDLDFNDDDNEFVVTIDKEDADVTLEDCEFVHRAVLKAFDRDIEDYSLTVTSRGMDPDEADEILKNIKE